MSGDEIEKKIKNTLKKTNNNKKNKG